MSLGAYIARPGAVLTVLAKAGVVAHETPSCAPQTGLSCIREPLQNRSEL